MKKQLLSIRIDADLLQRLRAYCKKHGKVNQSIVVNASLHHLLVSPDKKRQKYIGNYLLRDFGGGEAVADD